MNLICWARGHRRGSNVWHDTLDFRSQCVRCQLPMIRDDLRGGWRLFDSVSDQVADRVPHP